MGDSDVSLKPFGILDLRIHRAKHLAPHGSTSPSEGEESRCSRLSRDLSTTCCAVGRRSSPRLARFRSTVLCVILSRSVCARVSCVESACQRGEVSRCRGETPRRLGEVPRRRGEASHRRGEASCRGGEVSGRRGEVSHRRGEASCRHGDLSGGGSIVIAAGFGVAEI